MVRQEDVDFYCGFSRKELQSLCKKYNLPANRSRTDMAELLASYFEKNSLNSVGYGVGVNRDSAAATSRAVNRTWDTRRDSYGNGLDRYKDTCFQGAVAREPGFIIGDNTHYQERNGNGGLIDSACPPPYMRNVNEKGSTANAKKNFICRTNSRLENRMKEVDSGGGPTSSSFEFHVSSEEGISLSVDLNFNPSEWINSMRDEVNVFDSMRRRKSPHSDLGISNATESKKQKSLGEDKDDHVSRESSVSPVMKDNTQLLLDHHSNGERCLTSSAIEPCNRNEEGLDTCKETNGHLLSIPDSLVHGQIIPSYVESYSKSSSVHPVELDCDIPPVKKLASDSVMVADEQNHLLIEIPENPSMESFKKFGNSSAVICPRVAGSELLLSSEAEAFPPSSPLKTSRSSNSTPPELIIDREFTSYSESFKFQYNGSKKCLPPNTLEQEKSNILSKRARSE